MKRKKGDYAAIKAELTSSKGMEVAIVKVTTGAAATLWGVELSSPTFKDDKTIDVNAKVTFSYRQIQSARWSLINPAACK